MSDLEAEHLARLKRLGHTYTLNLIMELKQKVEQLEARLEEVTMLLTRGDSRGFILNCILSNSVQPPKDEP